MLAGYPPIVLSLVPTSYFTFPYFIILIGFVITIASLLVLSPSLRKHRRKKNILFYVAVFLVIALLVFQIDDLSRQAVVSYWFAGSDEYHDREGNQLVMNCENYGNRAASFNLVLSSVNASFQVKTQQNYIQINRTTVKVPFLLRESGQSASEASKPVVFTIDQNVTGFSFSFSVEAQNYPHLVVSSGDMFVWFAWNATENCYKLGGGKHFT